MKEIFINLKRFDVPRALGGICPQEDAKAWIEEVVEKSIGFGLGKREDVRLVYMLPEALIIPAVKKLESYEQAERKSLHIGCQGVFRENVQVGGNFGAFTTHLPAAAAYSLGCKGTIIAHSEERKDKQGILAKILPDWEMDSVSREKVAQSVDELVNEETCCALKQGLHVLFCVGETAKERGEGELEAVKENIKKVLKLQLERGLKGTLEYNPEKTIVIGYEPLWAIGPGKTPPGKEYIAFVATYIKEVVKELYGFDIKVVYGGGLKEENAEMIGSIDALDGGLVALTKFTQPIGFDVEDLKKIIDKYMEV